MHAELDMNPELTFDTAKQQVQLLQNELSRKEVSSLSLNLKPVKQCDSAGLAVLIEANRMANQFGKQIRLLGVSKEIKALAKFCGVEVVLNDK